MDTNDEVPCSHHPCAPHGFSRNASHSEDRYVCECEGWSPDRSCAGLELLTALRELVTYVVEGIGDDEATEVLKAQATLAKVTGVTANGGINAGRETASA